VSNVDTLVEDVCAVSAKPRHFLREAFLCVGNQFQITAIPEFVAVCDCSSDAVADRFNRMFGQHLGSERRQVPMPIHNLGVVRMVSHDHCCTTAGVAATVSETVAAIIRNACMLMSLAHSVPEQPAPNAPIGSIDQE
jgi:hypothetical protein